MRESEIVVVRSIVSSAEGDNARLLLLVSTILSSNIQAILFFGISFALKTIKGKRIERGDVVHSILL